MTKTIYKMVYYARGSFWYQLTEDSPLQGPFDTRESAVADAKWNLHHVGGYYV